MQMLATLLTLTAAREVPERQRGRLLADRGRILGEFQTVELALPLVGGGYVCFGVEFLLIFFKLRPTSSNLD